MILRKPRRNRRSQNGYDYPHRTPTFYGMKADTKPTQNVQNGAKFIEIDTHEEFYFDEAGTTWYGVPVPETP